jgi:hypothetical protein
MYTKGGIVVVASLRYCFKKMYGIRCSTQSVGSIFSIPDTHTHNMGNWGWMKTRIGKFLLLHRREIKKKKKK